MGQSMGKAMGPLEMAGGLGATLLGAPSLGVPLMTSGLGSTIGGAAGGNRGAMYGGLAGGLAGLGGTGLAGIGPLGSTLGGTSMGQGLQGMLQGTPLGNLMGLKAALPAAGAPGSSVAAGVTPTPAGAPGAFPAPGAAPIPMGAGGAAGSAMPLGDISREIASQAMTGSPGALPGSDVLASQQIAAGLQPGTAGGSGTDVLSQPISQIAAGAPATAPATTPTTGRKPGTMSLSDVTSLMTALNPYSGMGTALQGAAGQGAQPPMRRQAPQQQQTGATGTWAGGAPPSQMPGQTLTNNWMTNQLGALGAAGSPLTNLTNPLIAQGLQGAGNMAGNLGPVAANALNPSGMPAGLQQLLARLQGMAGPAAAMAGQYY